MPAPKKTTAKSKVNVRDLKAKKNPKGGHVINSGHTMIWPVKSSSADGSVNKMLGDGSVRPH